MEDLLNLSTAPDGQELERSTYFPAALAYALVKALPREARVPIPNTGMFLINKEYVPQLAELLHEVIAYTVSSLIDAGSERDAVMENDRLRVTIEEELYQWSKS